MNINRSLEMIAMAIIKSEHEKLDKALCALLLRRIHHEQEVKYEVIN